MKEVINYTYLRDWVINEGGLRNFQGGPEVNSRDYALFRKAAFWSIVETLQVNQGKEESQLLQYLRLNHGEVPFSIQIGEPWYPETVLHGLTPPTGTRPDLRLAGVGEPLRLSPDGEANFYIPLLNTLVS